MNADGTIRQAGIAITAVGAKAMRVNAAEAMLVGQKPSLELLRAAAEEAPKIATPNADARGSVDYKKDMARVLVLRGLKQSLERLGVQA